MKGRKILVCGLALALLAALASVLGQAQGQGLENQEQAESANSPEALAYGGIPIQGRLTDPDGKPVPDGDYTLTFRLYEGLYGGVPLCDDMDGPPDDPLNPVSVLGGLFSAFIDNCDEYVLNGQRLYLGLEVGDDGEMSPRQIIGTVPYARSLQPGADIRGDLYDGTILSVENTATDSSALTGYASAGSGMNMGVHGMSSSPDGLGGYFANWAGGYGLGVYGGMEMSSNAGPAKAINMGDRYRDNAIVAWGRITGGDPGTIATEFGISAVDHYNTGCYRIYLDASAQSASYLIPMAVAEIDSAPVGAGAIRIVSVNQRQSGNFSVYINDGNGNLVNNDFIFVVTGR
jgi:hypothetical protein